MTTQARVVSRRDPLVRLTIGTLFTLGVTATAGGAAMTFGLGDEEVMLPTHWLDAIPLIDSWLVPGMVLAIGFGLGSLFVGYGMVTRRTWRWARPIERATGRHWAWLGTLLIGSGHIVWIALEFVFLPEVSSLMVIYGIIGVALFVLPLSNPVRRYLGRS